MIASGGDEVAGSILVELLTSASSGSHNPRSPVLIRSHKSNGIWKYFNSCYLVLSYLGTTPRMALQELLRKWGWYMHIAAETTAIPSGLWDCNSQTLILERLHGRDESHLLSPNADNVGDDRHSWPMFTQTLIVTSRTNTSSNS